MAEDERQRLYREDATTLCEIGAMLAGTDLPRIEIRLPRTLAERAVAAWQRDEDGSAPRETAEQRSARHKAAALALIGLSIETDGRWDGDHVTVGLSPDLIGDALNAADDSKP
jgi:hypothetical protein